MDKTTHDKGLEIRKAVLGEAYVANALKNSDEFNKPFQELVTEYSWGAVWGREELPRKTRSMLNLAFDPEPAARIAGPHQGRAGQRRDQGRDSRDLHAGGHLCRRARGRRQFSHRARSVR